MGWARADPFRDANINKRRGAGTLVSDLTRTLCEARTGVSAPLSKSLTFSGQHSSFCLNWTRERSGVRISGRDGMENREAFAVDAAAAYEAPAIDMVMDGDEVEREVFYAGAGITIV